MANEIITTLHPDQNPDVDLYPNVKKDNIPFNSIDINRLGEDVINLLNNINKPKYASVLPTTNQGLIVYSDGYIYVWDGSQYINTNILYQATSIALNSINLNNLSSNVKDELDVFSSFVDSQISLSFTTSGGLLLDGSIGSYADWKVTDFIDVTDHTFIKYKCYGYKTILSQLCFYDENYDLIKALNDNDGDVVAYSGNNYYSSGFIMIPLNTKYIRLGSNNNNISNCYLYFNSKYLKENTYNYNYVKKLNAYNSGGLLLDGSTGTYGDWYFTDFINLLDFKNIIVRGFGYKNVLSCFALYDNTKTLIKAYNHTDGDPIYYSGNNYYMEKEITLPSNAKYIKIGYHTNSANVTMKFGAVTYRDLTWYGKRCCFLGDSMTEGTGTTQGNRYWEYMEEKLGICPYSFGVSGARWFNMLSQAQNMYSRFVHSVDVIFIWCGTNDYMHSTPIDKFFDVNRESVIVGYESDNVTPIYEDRLVRSVLFETTEIDVNRGINNVFNYLKTNYPDKLVVYMTPIHRGEAVFLPSVQETQLIANSIDLFFDRYIEEYKKIGEIWSIPIIDLYSDSGLMFEMDSYSEYCAQVYDHLHPNAKGYKRISNVICENLKIITPDYE